jgi:hypothetical protein
MIRIFIKDISPMNTQLLILILTVNIIYPQSGIEKEEKLISTDTITVNPELPQHIIKVYSSDKDEWESIVKINAVGDTTLLQSFGFENGELNMDDDLKDINFDGYNDLEIISFFSRTLNTISSFWLFNPKLKIFEESDEFSEFGDIKIDKKNQTIRSWGLTTGNDKSSWSSTYKVVSHHLVLIEDEEWYRYEHEKKALQGDSMVTVSKSYVEKKYDSAEKQIGNLLLQYCWIINTEEMIYGKLRPVKRVWQWLYEGSNSEEVNKRLVQEHWGQEFVFEKEIRYEYSMDEDNNIYVQETVGDIINGEWVTQTKPKALLK